ncbi:MAG: methionine--tRNA ligase [Deltaproteobacteria bacterium]|nr:methionine--tRNA ligase [Deltaproteobacteria bacterium]
MNRFYVSTPIYYVNDRPHIGHVYSTTVADILARYHRMIGEKVFFLTGTDEHAAKVADAAAERGISPLEWADRNAGEFQSVFSRLDLSHDDFIRTSELRHTDRVRHYVRQLIQSGDVYLGEYEGWYDPSQEEYVPETRAKEADFCSSITGKPLERKKEKNYFFRLSRYSDDLLALLESGEIFNVRPEARRNEVTARIRDGLNDIPMSRTGVEDWGIRVPGDSEHTIYVWIDALFNYLTAVDTDDRRDLWPADVQIIAKDILWFHAVIWPALLLALQKQPGNAWIALPRLVYCHSFWIREGRKMSKSLGNFIDLEEIDRFTEVFGLDGLRHFLASHGPWGTTDSDFSLEKFIEVYNSDLANTVGNCLNRVTNMTHRYFQGSLPAWGPRVPDTGEYDGTAARCLDRYRSAFQRLDIAAASAAALELVKAIDGYIAKTQPFRLAKDEAQLPVVSTILYNCAEALRLAAVLLWPIVPQKAGEILQRLGCSEIADSLAGGPSGKFEEWTKWGWLQPGTTISQGAGLFPRVDKKKTMAKVGIGTAGEGINVEAKEKGEKAGAGTSSAKDPVAKKVATGDAEGGAPEQISIDNFFETQLRVATVKEAEPVPKSNKLLKLTVDLGEVGGGTRTVIAGIAKAYSPEELVGQQVVVVANLKPAKLMGLESNGMVLAASVDGKPVVVRPSVPVPDGTQVR